MSVSVYDSGCTQHLSCQFSCITREHGAWHQQYLPALMPSIVSSWDLCLASNGHRESPTMPCMRDAGHQNPMLWSKSQDGACLVTFCDKLPPFQQQWPRTSISRLQPMVDGVVVNAIHCQLFFMPTSLGLDKVASRMRQTWIIYVKLPRIALDGNRSARGFAKCNIYR